MSAAEIFDIQWQTAVWRLALNVLVVTLISRFLYFRHRDGTREYIFTYISTSVIIFIVCILLNRVPVELGFALGLFAVFSVIRFRSVQASQRELSYLFICMGFALMNALLPMETSFVKILLNNLLVLLPIALADQLLFRNDTIEKSIQYDRLDLLEEGKRGELEEDLKTRFGITGITRIRQGDVDVLKGRVRLKVTIRDRENRHFTER